ncbi:MAG TPA: EscU/YscU/HrcU family type III secretion system export apparatus switch protein [Pseudobacteroides sp.]|uniref:EscU/YscU/HrcU family type III secretion system export apparatus switch protein n=1 Tax=Pseudobacteroides sp. TaxID=1968840 RepID=UPI002F94CA90
MDKKQKKIKEAAALKYNPGENSAPKIVALAKGEIAEKIVERAVENDVPVYENAQLAHALNALNLGDEIPPELYEVVAEILVFVGSIDSGYGEANGKNK